jgi:hypothetical protein
MAIWLAHQFDGKRSRAMTPKRPAPSGKAWA